MKKLIVLLLMAVFFVSCNGQNKGTSNQSGQAEQSGQIIEDVNVDEFADLIKEGKGLLLDVRTPEEYRDGHLEGTSHIDFYSDNFKSELAKLDPETPVYVYCRSGGRSGNAAKMMNSMGFKAVYNLEGGITAWSGKGKEVVR